MARQGVRKDMRPISYSAGRGRQRGPGRADPPGEKVPVSPREEAKEEE